MKFLRSSIIPTAILFFLSFAMPLLAAPATAAASDGVEIRIKPMPEGVRKIYLVNEDDSTSYRLLKIDGSEEKLSPDVFSRRLARSAARRPPLFRLLNISSSVGIAWVLLGLLGQVLFTGRMVVQWLTSEKARRSVVPVAFWWMSLSGATMLLIYFSWRRDLVGILGQSTGWFIYSRNLWMIYRGNN